MLRRSLETQPAWWALAALAVLTAVRLALAAVLPLAPDEAYCWIWSRALAPGYFDHPPVVALWIRASTALFGDGAFGVRALGPISGAIGSALLWFAAERLFPRTGLLAAALLNATLLFGVGSIVMTPDSPLLFFWICAMAALAQIVAGRSGWWWLAVGLFTGAALASKYTALLLAVAIVLWLLASERRWLGRPEPYLGGLVALAVFAPVLWWNIAHGWRSFAKQGERLLAWHGGRALQFEAELFGGQIGLLTPLVFLFCAAGMLLAARIAWRTREPRWTLLALLGGIPALVFIEHALADRVQANWPAIIYPAAAIAGAKLQGNFWRKLRTPAIALGFGLTTFVYVQAVFAPVPIPVRQDATAIRLGGWPELAAQVDAARRAAGVRFVAADEYGLAAELARQLPSDVPVLGIEPRWTLFDLPTLDISGQTGLLVRSERRRDDPPSSLWQDTADVGAGERRSGSQVIERYRFEHVTAKGAAIATVLPSRGN